jgi:hypothetical protein
VTLFGAVRVDRAQVLAMPVDVPEAARRFASGLIWCHSPSHELLHRHVEVKLQLLIEVTVDGGRTALDAEETTEA